MPKFKKMDIVTEIQNSKRPGAIHTGCLQKCNLFYLKYLKDESVKLFVVIQYCHTILSSLILAFYDFLERRYGVSECKYDFQDFLFYVTN